MKFASVMNIAKDVFDNLRNGNDPREYASDILAWVDGEICYEILFQTGYFPYSFFTDELPRTHVLEKWLEKSTDI
jgi:hypothetical protein